MGFKINGIVYDVPPPKCKDCGEYLTEDVQLNSGLCGECGEGSEKEARLVAQIQEDERKAKEEALKKYREQKEITLVPERGKTA